jgi:signal recognition particle subunit SRP54
MDRLEALFHSMTPRERLRPQTLDVARRRRVARGAGQPLAAVNDLMKRYQQMGKAMKKLGKMGMGSMIGGKDKRAALAGMSGTGAMMDPSQGKGGMMGGLGGLLGGAGGGMGAGMPPGMAGMDPSSMMEGANARGSSATRKSGKDLDKKKREKAKAKARRKNRRKK